MKKYKELKKQLFESEVMDGGALGQWPTNAPDSAHSDYGVHRIESEEQVNRLQAFLNTFANREYLDPRAALSLLRVKLNFAGLDFDFNNKTEITPRNQMVFKLKRFGGTFGTTPTHDLTTQPFKVTDGIEDMLGGNHLNLVVNMNEAESGLYKLTLNIVETAGTGEHAKAQRTTD
jgi:hypothetical protein